MYPRSPLYAMYLAGQQVREVYGAVGSALGALQDALLVLRKRSLPVRDVSSLMNAQVALFELSGLVARTTVKDITQLPAYGRMNTNLNRFLAAVGSNVKSNGQLVQTPEEARKSLPRLVNNLQVQVTEYFRRVALLADGMANYNSCNLAQIVSTTVINNALVLLSSRAASLSAMSEVDRLVVLRQTILEVLGVQTVVKNFGSFPGLSSANSLTGNIVAFTDADRPANPAEAVVFLTSGLVLVPGDDHAGSTNILDVWVDGAPPSDPPSQEFMLPGSVYPRIELTTAGPYVVDPAANSLNFLIDNTTTVTCVLGTGSRTAAQVASDFDTALNSHGYTAEVFFLPVMYDGEVITDAMNKVSLAFGNFPPSSITPGDEVDFYYGPDAIQTRTVTSVHTTGSDIDYFYVDGAALTAATTDRIRSGNVRSVRIIPLDKKASILARSRIQVKLPNTLEQQTALSLGIYGEVYGQGQATDADVLVSQVTGSSTLCSASTRQNTIYTGSLTTDPADPTVLITSSPVGIAVDQSVVISEGPNAGKYFIDSIVTPGTYKLRSLLPKYSDGFGQPFVDQGTIGFDGYVVTSKNMTLASSVYLEGPGSGGVGTAAGPARGTTNYVKFSSGYKGTAEGDDVEFYYSNSSTPDFVAKVLQVFSDGVVRLDAAVFNNASLRLSPGALPFAKLVTGHVSDFETLAAALVAQLQKPDANPTTYFKDLNRLINPLAVNTNPTDSDIGTAEARVNDLEVILTAMDSEVEAYNPDHVPQLDEMVKALAEKGVDRGLDLLLSCEFNIFFGLTQEQTSYAGAFQAAVRDVARNDMVIHKTDRLPHSQLKSSAESPDMEYSQVDLDRAPVLDPPTGIDYVG